MVEQHATERSIFLNAIEMSSDAERLDYLDKACGRNSELRRAVENLLGAHDAPQGLLDAPDQVQVSTVEPASDLLGTSIGPYKLLEIIGEGGFGIVFLAEQTEPVRREVALKIIKPGMDSQQVIARFEAERQALAMMDHANIAKVFDGGTTATGRPYFVMELVKGVPINHYCDQCRLPIHERLKLFLKICHAVQHAHQKGIIHRDLKPSNVLIAMEDGHPAPKIIDFGVAKAIGHRLTDHTLRTQFTQMIGTPMYMSPEQAELSPIDIDTRSDIYSLGVLLYELLTGTTPFASERLKSASFDELRRIIREEEPPRPSVALSTLNAEAVTTIANNQRTAPRQLATTLRGDLDWIVMKTLEKDRARRYQSASELAADIERHLADEPVHARPPSKTYRVKKFVRKHHVGVAAATALVVVLSAATALSSVALSRAVHERDRAREHLYLGCQLIDDAIEPSYQKMKYIPHVSELRDLLLTKSVQFYDTLDNHAANDLRVRHGHVRALLRLAGVRWSEGGELDGEVPAKRSIAIAKMLVRDDPENPTYHRTLASAHQTLASEYRKACRFNEAIPHHESAMAAFRQAFHLDPSRPSDQLSPSSYANSLMHLGRFSEAQAQFEGTLRKLSAIQKLGQTNTTGQDEFQFRRMSEHRWFADLLMHRGRYDAAQRSVTAARRLALEGRKVASQAEYSRELFSEYWIAETARASAKLNIRCGNALQAEQDLGVAINRFSAVAAEVPEQIWVHHLLGFLHFHRGRAWTAIGELDEALHSHQEAIDAWSATDLPHERFKTGHASWLIGEILYAQGDLAEAEQRFAQAQQILERFREERPNELIANHTLAAFLSNCPIESFRDPDRAIALARHVLTDSNGPLWFQLGLAQYRAGNFADALQSVTKSIRLRNGGDALDRLLFAAIFSEMGESNEVEMQYRRARKAMDENRPIYYGQIGILGFQRMLQEVEHLATRTEPSPSH